MAIVAGETEKAVDKALRVIKVKYQVLEPVLDFRKALDNPVLVHPEDNWMSHGNTGDVKRNLLHHEEDAHGDVEAVLADCEEVIEHSWRIKAAQQGYMETIRAYCEIDRYGRLHCISSTQIVFHIRRILANALGISKSMVRAEKPRIGGGFGAKQTAVCEVYPAFVTWMTKRPSKIIYSRRECQTIASPRHEMEVTVRLGAMKDGHIRAIDLYTLSNGGAYGEHSTTTVGLSGHKAIPLYTGGCEATRFSCDVVYTNVQAAGAYRGYGATQGIFALESTVNELAEKLHTQNSAVSRTLKNLEDHGWICRMTDPKDRRNTCVALTESGEDMQQNMTCTMQEFGRAVISQMDEQDLKKLIVCLDELYDIAAEEIEKRSMRNRKEGQHGKDF